MAKKKLPENKELETPVAIKEVEATLGLTYIVDEFGRADLNALRDKVNQIIAVINAL